MKLHFTDKQLKTLLDKAYTPEVRNQDEHIRNFAIGMYNMGWKDGQESTEELKAEIAKLEAEKSGPYFNHYQQALGKIAKLEAAYERCKTVANATAEAWRTDSIDGIPVDAYHGYMQHQKEQIAKLETKLDTALSWIDGAKVAVELWDREGHPKWRENMMRQALELLK